jgi:hypothetical protein
MDYSFLTTKLILFFQTTASKQKKILTFPAGKIGGASTMQEKWLFLVIVFGLRYVPCGQDRPRLNNARKMAFSCHCIRLALRSLRAR